MPGGSAPHCHLRLLADLALGTGVRSNKGGRQIPYSEVRATCVISPNAAV